MGPVQEVPVREGFSMTDRITGFLPVINSDSRVLILGSMPGVPSLKAGEYYGNPRNQFWSIMRELFGHEEWASYEEKCAFILEHRLALWDAAASCVREGSLDARIRGVQLNDFTGLFATYTNIRAVICNGKTAYAFYHKAEEADRYPCVCMPSTSPASTMPFLAKLEQWRKVLDYLV